MRHIAIFVKNLSSGGAEKQSVLLAKALSENYYVHYIILNGSKIHQKYLEMLNEDNRIDVAYFIGNHILRFKQFLNYLKEKKIEAIFSYLTAANAYACAASMFHKMKVYTGIRNAMLPKHKLLVDRILTNIFATKTIANCYSGKAYFSANGFKKQKIEVIPNCIEYIKPYQNKEISQCLHIITVGRFVKQKDYETAIKTLAEVKKRGGNIHFDIVGYGKLESEIRKWVEQYQIDDITTIYINPDNIAELLDKADLYLSTSLFEGTSNSIMEGMNANLPIICTNVGDNTYLVKDKQNGYLTEIGNVDQLASSIYTLLNNNELRKRMGILSKQYLNAHYSVCGFRQAYINILENTKKEG